MTDSNTIVREHYARHDLIGSLLNALKETGKDVNALTREDLANFDEFHIRGRDATREVADLAGLRAGMEVLDVGCGIGGPARTLAAEYGCSVHGIDLVEEYVEAAEELTSRVGLSDQVQFTTADALQIPFPDSRFDAALMEHASMNIPDKNALFREIRRVLRPDGVFADYVICAGPELPVHYPVPWSDDGRASFLIPPDDYTREVEEAGFSIGERNDVTAESLAWIQDMMAKMAARPAGSPPPLGLNLIMGDTAAQKLQNVARNLQENRIRVLQLVGVKGG